AKEFGLPGWWLNEQASAYVAPGGDPGAKLGLRPPRPAGIGRIAGAPAGHEGTRGATPRRRGHRHPRQAPRSIGPGRRPHPVRRDLPEGAGAGPGEAGVGRRVRTRVSAMGTTDDCVDLADGGCCHRLALCTAGAWPFLQLWSPSSEYSLSLYKVDINNTLCDL